MTNVHRLLPRLIVNRRLLQAVVDEARPCCALGFVEERKMVLPLIMMGLPEVEDLHDLGDGFRLGIQVVRVRSAELMLLLDFELHGRRPLQVALDPVNAAVRRVLGALGRSSAYFVLVVGAHGVTAFRADADEMQRRWVDDLLRSSPIVEERRIERLTAQERVLVERGNPNWQSLVWLRSDDASLLDLSVRVRYELRPAR